MRQLPEFSSTEQRIVRETVGERYGKDVTVDEVEVELRLNPEHRFVTPCPALYWSEGGTRFVIAKTAPGAYRCQFYYRGFEQYGTGREVYDDLAECVITLLQVQAEHERRRAPAAARSAVPPAPPADNPDSHKY